MAERSGPKITEKSKSCLQIIDRCHKVSYRVPAISDWPVNVTVIWCCLRSAYELIHIFIYGEGGGLISMLKISRATLENLPLRSTGYTEFVHQFR